MAREVSGGITVFLSILFLTLMSFAGAVIASAAIQTGKSEKRISVDLAVESVFAEYQKQLLEEYDIFGIDSGYEKGRGDDGQVEERIRYYGPSGTDYRLSKVQYLTDYEGAVFAEQAVKSMLLGVETPGGNEEQGNMGAEEETWQKEQEKASEYEKIQEESNNSLEGALSQTEEKMPEENNPISHIKKLGESGFLKLICPDESKLSNKKIDLVQQPSHRTLQKGRGTFSVKESNIFDKVLFNEYLLKHFQCISDSQEDKALSYELEYLLAGEAQDKENLSKTCGKLLLIRMASNYAFLMTDSAKQAEADTMAAALAALILSPGIQPIIKQGILLAWSYGEGIMDIRSLIGGGKVPLVKTSKSWQTGLESLLALGTDKDHGASDKGKEGLSYKEYLRMLLYLEKKEVLCMRALDLIEMNMKLKSGLSDFQADRCITGLEAETVCTLRRDTTYKFRTSYTYR